MQSKNLSLSLTIGIGWLVMGVVLSTICTAQALPAHDSLTISSGILGEQQKFFVYLPKDYEKSDRKYPVVYLLDGEYNSSLTADAVKTLSSWTSRMPPSIVVGIASNNRSRDLTPKPDQNWQPPQPIPSAGGADKFLEYLEQELVPQIEKNYRTQPLRTIIGHSLGGLLALHALAAKPHLFRFYVLLDSSIWWDDGRVAKRAMNHLNLNSNYPGRIVWVRDKIPREVWFPINTEFLAFLENKKKTGLAFTFMELENETHSSLIFPGTYMGLRELFPDFSFQFEEKSDLAAVQSHYDKVSQNYGYRVVIPEPVYHNLCGKWIYLKKTKEAVATCEVWAKDYPKSALANEKLGEAYLEDGNKESAVKYLSKSLELNPENSKARELLKTAEKR